MNGAVDWESALQTWLDPFLARLGHPARRRMCPLYVAGLIGPGERKSVQPMAQRLGLGSSGMPPRLRPSSWSRPTGWWAGLTRIS